jgi:hypothetical protein
VDCLIEVASLPPSDLPESYKPVVQNVLVSFVSVLQTILPNLRTLDLAASFETASEQDCLFISRLGLFLSTFLKSFLPFFETTNGVEHGLVNGNVVLDSFWYMIAISKVRPQILLYALSVSVSLSNTHTNTNTVLS